MMTTTVDAVATAIRQACTQYIGAPTGQNVLRRSIERALNNTIGKLLGRSVRVESVSRVDAVGKVTVVYEVADAQDVDGERDDAM